MAQAEVRSTKTYRIAAAIAALVVGLAMFGLLSLVGGLAEQPEERAIHSVHDVAWGVIAGLFLTVGWLMSLKDPERKVAILQVQVLVAALFVLVSLISGELVNPFTLAIVVLIGITTYLHPARARLTDFGGSFSPVLAVLSLIGLVLFAKFGWDQMDAQRAAGNGDEHAEELHYATMALFAFGVPLAGLIVSRKTAGWRHAGWLVGLGMALLGLVSILYENKVGALESPWSIAALVGGLVFIAAVEMESRGSATHVPVVGSDQGHRAGV